MEICPCKMIRNLSKRLSVSEIFGSLGLSSEMNYGVYDGAWKGSGPVVESIDPSTNTVLSKVRTVNGLLILGNFDRIK